MAAGNYSAEWYARRRDGVRRSAERILPLVFDVVKPASVIDVGCGTGTWLAEALRLGATIVAGLDGDHVDRDQLEIPSCAFAAADLSASLTFRPRHRYDLALCLEVAEHLPARQGYDLVGALCRLSPCVLFSAAIPRQPGNGHQHCRWQSYWAAMFARHDYEAIDCVRHVVWDDPKVSWWYRQNVILYGARGVVALQPSLQAAALASAARAWPLDVVHPQHHEHGR
jgi:SAM-dependent methyltransferase